MTVTNVGNPVLSELSVDVSYRLNYEKVDKTLRMNGVTLKKGKQHCWQDVFEGKSTFGVDWFGGKKLSDVKIITVNSKQGGVKVV